LGQNRYDRRPVRGWKPDFLPETTETRGSEWQVAPIPRDLEDRRVEITGPTDRERVINAGAHSRSSPPIALCTSRK
jgi:malate synthase